MTMAKPAAVKRAMDAFNAVFSTLVLRTAYGPTLATPATDDEQFLDTLSTMVRRYLFRS